LAFVAAAVTDEDEEEEGVDFDFDDFDEVGAAFEDEAAAVEEIAVLDAVRLIAGLC
jgi:hypothetical protein